MLRRTWRDLATGAAQAAGAALAGAAVGQLAAAAAEVIHLLAGGR